MYDPAIARFLSPDPYVHEKAGTQGYNRYSYCLNNPLKYTDESGEFPWLLVAAGAYNWVSNGTKISFEGLGYFGVGFLSCGLSFSIANRAILGASSQLLSANLFLNNMKYGAIRGGLDGFLCNFGNALIKGEKFADALGYGIREGFKSAAINGAIGGITAVCNGRNFWNGNKVDRFSLADTNIPTRLQKDNDDCLIACSEAILNDINRQEIISSVRSIYQEGKGYDSKSFWNLLSQKYGLTTNSINTSNTNIIQDFIVSNLNSKNNICAIIDQNHAVLITNVYKECITKLNGKSIERIVYKAMNPSHYGSSKYAINKLINVNIFSISGRKTT